MAATVTKGQSSTSRYKKELAFPLHMRTVSVGLSPAIWDHFTIHHYKDIATGLKLILPPVHLAYEQSVWDFGNAGAIGWGGMATYGKYEYAYPWNEGEVNVRTGVFNLLVGASYHYTVATRFEVYLRAMLGAAISNYKDDAPGVNPSWNSKFIWTGVAGARHYFSNTLGVFIESGYTLGYVNAGMILRW